MLLGIVAHDDATDSGNAHAQQYDTQHASDKYESRNLGPVLYIEGLIYNNEKKSEGCSRGDHDGEAALREQVFRYVLAEEVHLLFVFGEQKYEFIGNL